MIKTHKDSGLKYLCYTRRKDWQFYKGSGKYWKRHLKEHGENISTELLLETTNKAELETAGIHYSELYDVVNSPDWANLMVENGGGGDTVSSKIWIHDGSVTKYHNKNLPIPDGWTKGRLNCVFNNKEAQKEFNLRRINNTDKSSEEYKTSRKIATAKMMTNRDHSKCGVSGDANSSKRPEVKAKIRKAALERPSLTCPCGKVGKGPAMHRFHFKNCRSSL